MANAGAAKATSCRDAIRSWEQKNGVSATESEKVTLYFQNPPLDKMDASLGTLTKCRHLALSTNQIDRITNLHGLQCLEILSLGRNLLKGLTGLEPVANTLQQLWVSYNGISSLSGIGVCKRLKILYMAHNKVEKWNEFEKLQELPVLHELLFLGNPLEEKTSGTDPQRRAWMNEVMRRLPNLKKLEGIMCVSESAGEGADGEGGKDAAE
eukprot:gnl/Hemi2/24811_TR8341_c0_g1_i1.p1 gnl/Hemi2/24811_TR8341_c0_g1~~gnl/Hemi2/24811_TR8341_c0_g1_i1.p1  ORF type:complete len:210 (+),score=70.69 gnl/Hemi2/24811_TR8341_c0_g1_i1:69-698(+)